MPSTSIPTSRARRGASGGLTAWSLGRARAALVVLLLATAAVVTGPASAARACDCASLPAPSADARADVVFTGTLLSRTVTEPVTSSTDPATWVFAVDRALKGEVPERASVRSAVSGASCGLELTGRGPFVVFAGDAGTHLTAHLCDGTARLTPTLERQITALADGSGTVVARTGPSTTYPDMEAEPAHRLPRWGYLAGAGGLLVLVTSWWRLLRPAR